MSSHTLTQAVNMATDLKQFTGTEVWYKHPFSKTITYTEGVQYLAEKGGAYWLLDELVLAQRLPRVKKEEFQVWTLTVKDHLAIDAMATLTCEDGNGHKVYSKVIEFTDFPLSKATIWLTDNVMLLPSEY
jgi:hypothetical protein